MRMGIKMKIIFLPSNKAVETEAGKGLLDACLEAGITIDGNCGGAGICGKCKVQVISGDPGEASDEDKAVLTETEIRNGFRLACRLFPAEDITVQLPRYDDTLKKKADLSAIGNGLAVDNNYSADRCFGLSFDVGTTTVVGMLWNLVTGELLEARAESNPQAAHGADVISRIMFAGGGDKNLRLLKDEIIGCLSRIAAAMIKTQGISSDVIYEVTIVGNTTMSHLVVGVDPRQLAVAPFKPVFCDAVEKSAGEFGIRVNPGANVTLLPNIAGHVGSDITADIIASGIAKMKGAHLLIDIGTNGEIVLCRDGESLTCSTAAGPAFEGAAIYQGMRAASGAIERVDMDANGVSIRVIEGLRPIGICGSGILDAVGELWKVGGIDRTGRMLDAGKARENGIPEKLASRLREGMTGREFVLAYNEGMDDIVITQKDIREVQLAKAAMRAGINLMLQEFDLEKNDIDSIFVAGAFGNHIRTESAVGIGLIPRIGEDKVKYIGNSAGVGAGMALLSRAAMEEAKATAKAVRHVELAANPHFQEAYLAAMSFE